LAGDVETSRQPLSRRREPEHRADTKRVGHQGSRVYSINDWMFGFVNVV
jgi:hypothetical protein